MTAYKFELFATYLGDELDDTGDDAKLITLAAEIGLGVKAKTPSRVRDAYAKANGFTPEEIGVQVWGAFEAKKKAPSFTLVYFAFVDGGVLFHGETAKPANLMLWQHGFEPIDEKNKAPDAAALTKAFFAAK